MSNSDDHASGPTPLVDIIVPLYRDLAASRRCVESVLAHTDMALARLVLVDDASPEQELSAWASSLAAQGEAELLRHEQNLGFVAAVNAGMALHTDRDVVLLNSDTEVPAGWLERLRSAAASAEDIATVTPFSNNGSICSYPKFCATSSLPKGLDLAMLDCLFAEANPGRVADLPTAVGFCMYIRRAALQRFGYFDAERYGRGYGEENDFSRRVAAAGLRNVLCAGLFVFHEGAVSFGEDRQELMASAEQRLVERYPDYGKLVADFVAEDPLRHFRAAVDARRLDMPGQGTVLFEEWQAAREALLLQQQESVRVINEYDARCEQYEALLQQQRDSFRQQEVQTEQRSAQYEALLAEAREAFALTDKALHANQEQLVKVQAELEAVTHRYEQVRMLLSTAEQQLTRLNSLLVVRFGRWLKEMFTRT